VAGTTAAVAGFAYGGGMSSAGRSLDAVVVGAGPNGLTAAARLARAGRRVLVVEAASTVGGGSRTRPLGDARIDVCAAVHPFGASSPAFEALDLAAHGLTWSHPPIALAHPFDDGAAATLLRSTVQAPHATADGLGADGARWRQVVDPFSGDWARWRHLAMDPVLGSIVHHPLSMTRFGMLAGLPATVLGRLFSGRDARSLLAGMAAHSGTPLSSLTSGGVALALAAAGQGAGMPVATGGSQSIVDALAAIVLAAGGRIETGRRVGSLAELPAADAVLLDTTPGQAAAIIGAKWPRWRHGVAAWKLDLVLSGPMPWVSPACRTAGTVHLGGDARDVATAERATALGGLPDRPFVIVTQPTVADASRVPAGQHVVWAYRHVPNGCRTQLATAGIENQLDRFAPGWRELVLHRQVTTAVQYSQYNESYVGGDITGGAMTPWQTIARPRLALDPYRMGDGVWLCSQSTPPGPGVHGMCGWHAAGSVLGASRRRRRA